MQKTRIPLLGKKAREWERARAVLIQTAVVEGRIDIEDGKIVGICEDCKQHRELDPDHRKKRSQGGTHDKSNIDWVCRTCHIKRDNLGDPNNKKTKNKKPDWTTPHPCIVCKTTSRMLLCPDCGNISMKNV